MDKNDGSPEFYSLSHCTMKVSLEMQYVHVSSQIISNLLKANATGNSMPGRNSPDFSSRL